MEFVTVHTALNPADAQLIRAQLESAGFLVNVKGEDAALGMDGYAMAIGGILVQVPDDKVNEARQLLTYKTPPAK